MIVYSTCVYIGRTDTSLCPVSALLAYLAVRMPNLGPLFVFQDGTLLSREQLVEQIGLDVANYSGHGFRIGAASTAAMAGFNDSFIKTLGRWKSLAFTTYIRPPVEDLAGASAVLTSSPHKNSWFLFSNSTGISSLPYCYVYTCSFVSKA